MLKMKFSEIAFRTVYNSVEYIRNRGTNEKEDIFLQVRVKDLSN